MEFNSLKEARIAAREKVLNGEYYPYAYIFQEKNGKYTIWKSLLVGKNFQMAIDKAGRRWTFKDKNWF